MKYFTFNELTKSPTAIRKGINNKPDAVIKAHLTALVANVLDPLREAWGQPITVTSGYRCKRLNRVVGGASRSEHLVGCAADIVTVSDTFADNMKLFKLIIKLGLPFNQLIFEYGNENIGPDWIHVSFREGANKREILRAVLQPDGKTKYIPYKPTL